MLNRKIIFISLMVFFSASVLPCFAGGSREGDNLLDDGKLRVYVSILPQRYFVEKIGGERVSVDVMVLPGRSPTTYEPTPNQVSAMSLADVFFLIGVPFEGAFVPKISESLRSLRIVDTSVGIKKRMLEAHVHEDEEGGHGAGDAEDGSVDPHIWLSPVLVKKQAEIIYNTLVEIDPESEDEYTEGYSALLAELDTVHQEIDTILSPFRGSVLFVFHPSFGYFADEYGLRQVAVELEGREPAPSELVDIIDHAKESGAKIIFAQPEFSRQSVQVLADAIGGRVVVLNPLNPDYINNLREISAEIRKAYK